MKYLSLFFLLGLIALTGCVKQTRTVERISPNQQTDLSGRWNDTDSRLVAEEMVKDLINRPWRTEFMKENGGKKPTIIVGIVLNKSHEHIEAETFIKDIQRELINSGTVKIVQHGVFREKLREERADQQQYASPATQKKWGRELGADYMMFGTINSIVDSYNKEKAVYYQIDLELAHLETNQISWMGSKKIKKIINN